MIKVLVKDHKKYYYLIFIPPYLPDLNPIENLCKLIQEIVQVKIYSFEDSVR